MFAFCSQPSIDADTKEANEVNVNGNDGPKMPAHGVRTTMDEPSPAPEALASLKEGNLRFHTGASERGVTEQSWRQALSDHGQRPMAAVIGCADSRCPVEIMFDAKPGDIFVLRNAGNTCTHSEGSMVGSVEYAVQHLHTHLILVLGHTKCGAIAGATKTMLAAEAGASAPCSTVLEVLLRDLVPVAAQAKDDLPADSPFEAIAAHAVKVNVFHTIDRLLEYSATLRERVSKGDVEVHGGIYDLDTGVVDFLGTSPKQEELVAAAAPVTPVLFPKKDVLGDASTAVPTEK